MKLNCKGFIPKLTARSRNEDGFTLVELMVVILIIGILAAIAIPIFLNQQAEALKAAVKSDVRNTATSAVTALATNGMGELSAQDEANDGLIDIIRYDHLGNPVVSTTAVKVVASDNTSLSIYRDPDPAAGPLDYIIEGKVDDKDDWSYKFYSRFGTYTDGTPTAGGGSGEEEEVLDTDGDGLTDAEEGTLGTDPNNPNTDGDAHNDGAEVAAGTNPLDENSPTPAPVATSCDFTFYGQTPSQLGVTDGWEADENRSSDFRANGSWASTATTDYTTADWASCAAQYNAGYASGNEQVSLVEQAMRDRLIANMNSGNKTAPTQWTASFSDIVFTGQESYNSGYDMEYDGFNYSIQGSVSAKDTSMSIYGSFMCEGSSTGSITCYTPRG